MTELVQRALVGVLSASLMSSVGMRLEVAKLRLALSDKAFVAKTLAFNFCVFPLLTSLTLSALPVSEPVRMGLVLCAIGGGGCNSLLFIGKVDGDLAYGLLSIVVTGTIGALLLPWVVAMATSGSEAGAQAEIVSASLRAILLFQVAPTIAGYAFKSLRLADAERVAKVLSKVAEISLWTLTALFLWFKGHTFRLLGSAAAASAALVVVQGLVTSMLFHAPRSGVGKAFVFSGLIRNVVIALLLNEWILKSELTKLTILCYCFFMLLAAGATTFVYRRSTAAGSVPTRSLTAT